MPTVQLKICIGTTCYMLGASKLMNIETDFPPEWKDRVEVSASPCLGLCEADNVCHAPYVIIDGETIPNASPGRVISEIARRLGEPVPQS